MKAKIQGAEDLDLFKLCHELTLKVYELVNKFPTDERFGLVVQMQRSAYSIPMNLMEGSHRLSKKEYRQFVGIAKGSAGEMKYQLLLAKDLGYMTGTEYLELRQDYERVSQMLTRLAESLVK
jgi:four helix bundle protein